MVIGKNPVHKVEITERNGSVYTDVTAYVVDNAFITEGVGTKISGGRIEFNSGILNISTISKVITNQKKRFELMIYRNLFIGAQ